MTVRVLMNLVALSVLLLSLLSICCGGWNSINGCTTDCDTVKIIMNESPKGSLVSPCYPRNYPFGCDSDTNIYLKSGRLVAISFSYLDLGRYSNNSCQDYIIFRTCIDLDECTSPICSQRYCDIQQVTQPNVCDLSVLITELKIEALPFFNIHFHSSDQSSPTKSNYYELYFYQASCDETMDASVATASDPGLVESPFLALRPYPDDLECSWKLLMNTTNTITIVFPILYLYGSSHECLDYITLQRCSGNDTCVPIQAERSKYCTIRDVIDITNIDMIDYSYLLVGFVTGNVTGSTPKTASNGFKMEYFTSTTTKTSTSTTLTSSMATSPVTVTPSTTTTVTSTLSTSTPPSTGMPPSSSALSSTVLTTTPPDESCLKYGCFDRGECNTTTGICKCTSISVSGNYCQTELLPFHGSTIDLPLPTSSTNSIAYGWNIIASSVKALDVTVPDLVSEGCPIVSIYQYDDPSDYYYRGCNGTKETGLSPYLTITYASQSTLSHNYFISVSSTGSDGRSEGNEEG